MPRIRLAPRLYQRSASRWVILDFKRELAAGSTREEAEEALRQYLDPAAYRKESRARFLSRPGTVYFIEAEKTEFIKIGFTTSLPKRLADLRTSLPFTLKLVHNVPGPRALEVEIHNELVEHKVRGEWFSKPPIIEYLGTKFGIQPTE